MNNTCNSVLVHGEQKSIADVEKSIIKKYRKQLWTQFVKGINEYDMVQENDHIAVCISGGKDSLLVAKLLQELKRHNHTNFKLSFIAMDPGFTEQNRQLLESSCKKLGIDVEIFETQIFGVIQKIAEKYPCYMCARMRRGALYTKAQEIGANKICLGHHYDDFIETTMINMLYAGNYSTMLPKLKAKNFDNMELIRPMVYIREKDIINFTKDNSIRAMNCGCVVTAKQTSSKRAQIKEIIKQLAIQVPDVEKSIFASCKNVNADMVIGGKINDQSFSFMDKF